MNAIIFDLDGVLCHTDEYHYMAWKTIADELDIPFNRKVNDQLRGVSRMESLNLILRNSPIRYTEQEKNLLAEKKNNIYRNLLQNITSKDLADGAWTVLEKLHTVHIPLAIGSSSKNTPLIVEKLGIGKFFDVIVDGNQISHSKPNPEVFLSAAEKLHQKPSDCLVVEDAAAGVKAAINGGFPVAGIGSAKDCPNVNYPLISLSELLTIASH
ncbi:beta-phosphoglucomutase [Mageeibacillus indolicus UPII9-5]|uniref:Beta-phosphoglucomutase n=1 Tax=Mageeibacillus indolicus (strain UPII9-5) TaxID=699246 RepID=D3R1S2_MAGIU|nr:beta-phosphoglucomutase [Mageeibacillus indolicus]ADC90653.1 beta-phosphoglucomutase [Mageeibacillus indolicus UPII9-5]